MPPSVKILQELEDRLIQAQGASRRSSTPQGAVSPSRHSEPPPTETGDGAAPQRADRRTGLMLLLLALSRR